MTSFGAETITVGVFQFQSTLLHQGAVLPFPYEITKRIWCMLYRASRGDSASLQERLAQDAAEVQGTCANVNRKRKRDISRPRRLGMSAAEEPAALRDTQHEQAAEPPSGRAAPKQAVPEADVVQGSAKRTATGTAAEHKCQATRLHAPTANAAMAASEVITANGGTEGITAQGQAGIRASFHSGIDASISFDTNVGLW